MKQPAGEGSPEPPRAGRSPGRTVACRYGVALLLPLVALGVRLGLFPWLGEHNRFLLFYLTLAVSAWYGGLGPGLTTTVVGALLTDYFFVEPRYSLGPLTLGVGFSILMYFGAGLLVSALAESLHRARRKAEASAAALRESEARLRRVSDQAPCLLWSAEIRDLGGELLHWDMKLANPEAAQRFFPLALAFGERYQDAWWHSRLLEDQVRTALHGVEQIRAGRSYSQEFRCRRADGEICWFAEEIQIESLGPQRWRAVGVCTDITARRRLEEERERLQAELAQRAEQLEQADRAKDNFLAVLSHELRNPLGAISNAAQLLKLRAGADEPLSRSLQIIERQVEHQTRMLDDLLNVSRIVRGKLALHRIRLDLIRLVRDVAEDHRSAFERAGLALECALPAKPVWLLGDPTRLAQVLGNLLQNALKFTEPGGVVRVEVTPEVPRRHGGTEEGETDSAPGWAELTVSDTGMGIEPELLPHLFGRFTQAERTLERSRGGLGLGLALVKGLVELHGGSVAGHSGGPGLGAKFTVRLPLTAASTEEPAAPDLPAPSTGAWRILIVEDDEDAAVTLQELLEARGCEVAAAGNGAQALEMALAFHPEVVLCDLGLPGLDGYSVARRLRQLPETAGARLIAVSGYGQEEDRRRSQEAGFDRHLTKPVDLDELQQLLDLSLTRENARRRAPTP